MSDDLARPLSKPHEAWFENTWWWRIKVRLQWSGWLQYIPNLTAAVLMLLLAGIGGLIGVWSWLLVGLPLCLAALLFANLIFDIATVRFGLHPEEALPKPLPDLDAFDLMRARVSCRSFQNRDLSDEHREMLKELAHTYSRQENCIGSHPIRLEYLAAPLTVWPVVRANEFLVAVAERDYHEEAVMDIGRCLQKVVIEATRMGLGTCWIGPGADPSSIAKHMGTRFDPARDHVICVCAIGYASWYKPLLLRVAARSHKLRKALGELFYTDLDCSESMDPKAEVYAEFGRCFEACRWSPSSFNAQTTRAVTVIEEGRLVRMDFCVATKSRYYAIVALGIWLANWEYGCDTLGIGGNMTTISTLDDQRPDLPRYVISWQRDT
ncbi:nitroreductase family protein [Roseibium sediminis]|uniref:nitroreductase family protein n=1 Tax=Roseibium sediminis TaxID=1775174 RepID=UPI00123CE82E|nr:nitroreductase family protein [Roseibium sediminis]